MKNLLKKVRGDKKGFTLAELLVVVAIIGILVAISVPLFTAQLGKARKATNQANMRAAKIAAVAQYLTDSNDGNTVIYEYDLAAGTATATGLTAVPETYESKEIAAASSAKQYTGIYVSVKAADSIKNGDNTIVTIYVTPKES